MAIPDYQTIMLPFLKQLGDGQEHSMGQVIDRLANQFQLSDEEQRQLLPSGQQSTFKNRVGWACTYLKKSVLVEATKRGFFRISDRGLKVLKENPNRIDIDFLKQFAEFRDFRSINTRKQGKSETAEETIDARQNVPPEEALANAYQELMDVLANDLLQQVKASSPRLFESIVVDLLWKMGYGGSREDAAKAVGKSGDEGIDGIINEDQLGLDVIYIQAKKWEGTVGRPEVQKFAGALQGQHAKRGILITTSNFSPQAIDFASKIDSKIILIDGNMLVQLMMRKSVGLSTSATYELKRIDLDYFTE